MRAKKNKKAIEKLAGTGKASGALADDADGEEDDTATQDVIARIKAGKRSNGVIVHPDGKRVFVSSGGDGTVQVIDTASNAIVATIPVGKRPWNMALTPDGRKLYVACGRSDAVAVIDTTTNRKIADVPVGSLPWGVAIR